MNCPLLTPDDLAARWGVSRKQVYRLTSAGTIPVVRVGKHLRYRADAIAEWELST
jgi:excisionase family DNA binding protein